MGELPSHREDPGRMMEPEDQGEMRREDGRERMLMVLGEQMAIGLEDGWRWRGRLLNACWAGCVFKMPARQSGQSD